MRQLRKRQKKSFRGLHEWMADTWDCELATTDEVWRLKHPKVTVARVEAMVKALDAPALTALQLATMETKSLVLGLALVLRQVRVFYTFFLIRRSIPIPPTVTQTHSPHLPECPCLAARTSSVTQTFYS